MTTENQITKARKIAAELETAFRLSTGRADIDVSVDDWSDDASFRIFITLPVVKKSCLFNSGYLFKEGISLRKATWIIKRVMKRHTLVSAVEFVEMPKQKYESWKFGKMSLGYENPFIMMDFRVFNC